MRVPMGPASSNRCGDPLMTLIEWLRAQLDEDERVALASPGGVYLRDDASEGECDYALTFTAVRVLAEVKAKRRILDEVVPRIDEMDSLIESEWGNGIGPVGESEPLIKLLAQPYAGREGWQDEWSVR